MGVDACAVRNEMTCCCVCSLLVVSEIHCEERMVTTENAIVNVTCNGRGIKEYVIIIMHAETPSCIHVRGSSFVGQFCMVFVSLISRRSSNCSK